MSPSHKPAPSLPPRIRHERRAPRGAPGSARWLKGLLGRPVALEHRDGQLQLTLVERRRTPEGIDQQQRAQLCDEVRSLLLNRISSHDLSLLRHLVLVLDVLASRGWDGVGAMASGVLRKALMQAHLLDGSASTAALTHLIDQLRLLQVAAGVREERQRLADTSAGPERAGVGAATHGEVEALQPNRVQTVSSAQPSDEPTEPA